MLAANVTEDDFLSEVGGESAIVVMEGISMYLKPEQLQDLIAKENLSDKIDLSGTFCMGKCQQGVCVTADGEFFSVSPETVSSFFEKEIKARV